MPGVTGSPCLGVCPYPVEKNDSKKKKSRTESPEDEILDPRFQRLFGITVVGYECVKAKCDRLEGNEEHEEMIALTKEHQPGRGQHRQVVKFSGLESLATEVAMADDGDQKG